MPPERQRSQALDGSAQLHSAPDWKWRMRNGAGQSSSEVWQVCISTPLAPRELQQFFEPQLAARQYRLAPTSAASSTIGEASWLYVAPNSRD